MFSFPSECKNEDYNIVNDISLPDSLAEYIKTTEDELLFNDIISRYGPSVVVVFLFLPSPHSVYTEQCSQEQVQTVSLHYLGVLVPRLK